MRRRTFLAGAGLAGAGALAAHAQGNSIPIIDTHIHLFDTARPQGVPWPPKDSPIYRSALPDRYRQLAVPHGIVGAIEVEASSWLEDNQWVLDVAAKDTIIAGTVGDLEPGKPDFRTQLDRFRKNPLFRGIRYGNLWYRNLGAEMKNPAFVAGLKELAAAGLVLDTANPNGALVTAALDVAQKVPELRIVMDHLPQIAAPPQLRELASHRNVFAKISQVLRRVDGRVPEDPAFYRDRIDEVFGIFGEDRVMYGSDWPNSDLWAPYKTVFEVVHTYFAQKPRAVQEKYFWRNSLAAYGWVKRAENQPH